MEIQTVDTYSIAVPLHTPFKTALRTVTVAESIYVKVTCTDGTTGWGEAPPTHVITGESLASIQYTIESILKPVILGKRLVETERLFEMLHHAVVGNTSAKAAVDMALYDCLSQYCGLPLHLFLGGYHESIETDYTVSINEPEQMASDAAQFVSNGFDVLKIKVGKDEIDKDIKRIGAIRERIGAEPLIRLDANQGWSVKESIFAIQKMEDLNYNIELVEQPVKAYDIEGLKQVKNHTFTPIMADESVFSVQDARRVLQTESADLINIKLMKAGGIYQALKINQLAEAYGIPCMVGSMIETKLGISAAAHLAASQRNITRFDFDAPLMLGADPLQGGIDYKGRHITFSSNHGLGIENIQLDSILSKQT
ncbi:dipeptide epimerase [Halobacillus sp. A5]|uniref:dipeptide epimerase n=1 Tax=Halobacillus sp. A5 TaxID=2880263 RepID=UPI0020A67812|nr:dipeptide epimerase [Halobacillus sp. A5]MCP3028938.1 dipeptide epimerase [Halobacillus sp. A5]